MSERLQITELEFEAIKSNLKLFLQNQTTFKDYNFEGSAISQLINLLSYNTYYNLYYYSMMANELFIDSAQVRNSILSHAKALNYTPVSRRAPTAIIEIMVTPPGGNTQSQLTLNRFQEFQSEAIDGINYTFVTTNAVTVHKENGVFLFKNLTIKAGTPQTATFLFDPVTNPSSQFELPNDDVDTSTLAVTVQTSSVNTFSRVFSLSADISSSTSNTEVYYLSTSVNNKYKISFGDGAISKALSNGNIVIATYLTTDGVESNKANSFSTGSIGGFSNVSVTSISSAAGGAEREADDSVRLHAPLAYSSQGRTVSAKDFESILKAAYPGIQSIFVWGGEDNIPPVYGKVFISIAPKDGVIINNAEKIRIATDILAPVGITTITPVLVDPEYVYLKFDTTVEVDGKLTLLTAPQIVTSVRSAIIAYTDATFNQFGAIFTISKFSRAIDDALPAIIGSDTVIRLEKRFVPTTNVRATYVINFSTPLHHAPIQSALKSTAFIVNDLSDTPRTAYLEEVFNSSTGVDSITITNPGYGYVEPPTITITGDGTGAKAEATIVNGRIDTITVTKRGTSYTSALVAISGGGGQAGEASAVVQSKYGTLRLFYYNSNSEKVDINPEIGSINYVTGEITISDLNVIQSLTDSGDIRIDVEPEASIIETKQNQLLLLDSDDVNAITISVVMR